MTLIELAIKLRADSVEGKVNGNMPVFLLYGTDPFAQSAILEWVMQAARREVTDEKLHSALSVIQAMSAWMPKKIPD